MSAKTNLLLLKSIVTTELPPLLATASLTALDEYVLGGPTDSQFLSLGFYLGPGDESPEMVNFKPVLQLQLYGINYTDGLSYFDVIFDLLKSVDPEKIGMVGLDRLSYTEYPPDETGTTIFTFYIEYNNQLDDCDDS